MSPGQTAEEPIGEAAAPPTPETGQAAPPQTTGASAAETGSKAESRQQPLRRTLPGFAAVALALAAVPLGIRLRRRGDLVVVIDYPPDRRGNFRVRVASRAESEPPEGRAVAPNPTATAPALAPKSTRTERFLVTHEAQFSKLAARHYWVIVEGELRDANGDRVTPCFAQRTARVEPGRTLRLDFGFSPAAANPIEAAQALLAAGQADLALARLDEAFAGAGLEGASADALELYAGLLADVGRAADALAALDAARRRAPALPHLATRIEELRKRAEATTRIRAPSPTAGRYEILEEVGHGGMAVVYRARDKRLDRIVALKRISDNLSEHPRAVDLLLREARSAARLNHRHIVTVYDVDQEAGSYFITMEFLEGKTLLGLLQSRGCFAPKLVVRLGEQVAAGLAYAHAQRIVHRDIKTANLFFVIGTQTLKIMDFGLAKIIEEVRRRATVIGGTPSYMAPEQAQGLAVDGRADLYGFGVTLFELLTGTLPFEDGDLTEQHRHAPPPDPRARAEGIPDALAELVLQLLAKRPDDRPASAGEVAAKLREIQGALA